MYKSSDIKSLSTGPQKRRVGSVQHDTTRHADGHTSHIKMATDHTKENPRHPSVLSRLPSLFPGESLKIHVCILYLYVLTFLVILPYMCSSWPYSVYYISSNDNDAITNQVLEYNKKKFRHAQNYRIYNKLKVMFEKTIYENALKSDMDLLVVVVTVKRVDAHGDLGYVTRVVTEWDKIIRARQAETVSEYIHTNNSGSFKFRNIGMFVCDVFAGPGTNIESENLEADYIVKHRFKKPNSSAAILDTYEKEKEDYEFCMRTALGYTTEHVLMVEDDAVPRLDILPVMEHMVNNRMEKPWGYVKLYYPEKWQGYGRETGWGERVVASLVTGILFILVSRCCCNPRHKGLGVYLVLFVLGALYAFLLLTTLGRQHVLETKRLSPSFYTLHPAPRCCTPSVLYTRSSAESVASHLGSIKCSRGAPMDLSLADYMDKTGYRTYLIEPNLVKHVGFVSTWKSVSTHPEHFLEE